MDRADFIGPLCLGWSPKFSPLTHIFEATLLLWWCGLPKNHIWTNQNSENLKQDLALSHYVHMDPKTNINTLITFLNLNKQLSGVFSK